MDTLLTLYRLLLLAQHSSGFVTNEAVERSRLKADTGTKSGIMARMPPSMGKPNGDQLAAGRRFDKVYS